MKSISELPVPRKLQWKISETVSNEIDIVRSHFDRYKQTNPPHPMKVGIEILTVIDNMSTGK